MKVQLSNKLRNMTDPAEPVEDSDESTAVAVEEPVVRTQPERKSRRQADKDQRKKPKRQPPWAVIVHNDDEHTYDYVIECLCKVCGLTTERAFELAQQIDTAGRAVVWTGAREVAELKQEQIRNFGPDFYAMKTVRFPLGVTIEPLPGD